VSNPTTPPRIVERRLVLDGRPTLLLAGELHNSSGSTAEGMASRWAGIVDAGCDTVLAAVTWEQFEPEEGRFDPTAVDALLEGARAHGLRLVLLWFGSWKNGMSTYVPSWIKADPERFGVQHLAGRRAAVLSPFVEANVEAASRAFAAFMAHLHRADPLSTVVLVQVDNEVGSLGDTRDRSPEAEAAWSAPVPEALLAHLRADPDGCAAHATVTIDPAAGESADWPTTFGEGDATDELFMAWHLATYLERLASAGRAEHAVPLYVNAWLNAEVEGMPMALAGGSRPGTYPSGGPLPQTAAAWHAAAPTLDFLAPDIYAADPDRWLAAYRSVTAAVFVPELHRSPAGLETIFLAIGSHGAIGTAPFGIDELTDDQRRRLRRGYQQIAAIADDVLDAQASDSIRGFVVAPGDTAVFALGEHRFAVLPDLRFDTTTPAETGYGLLLQQAPGTFVVAGHAFMLMVTTGDGEPVLYHSVHELALTPATGRADDLPVLRWLNGDEILSGNGLRVTGDVLPPWPGGIPASASMTGLIRFSVLPGLNGQR
jgi:beta-galactosidase GanA